MVCYGLLWRGSLTYTFTEMAQVTERDALRLARALRTEKSMVKLEKEVRHV